MAKTISPRALHEALAGFFVSENGVTAVPYGCGHINATFLVTDSAGHRYILQCINEGIFPDVKGLMENIGAVLAHLKTKSRDPRHSMTLVPALDKETYFRTTEGAWRLYDFVEGSLCLQSPRTPRDFFESARAFGMFREELADFDAARLTEVLPDFHNTPRRYAAFHEAIRADSLHRAGEVGREIEFFLEREEEMATLQKMRESGELPLCVTHNDTKLNNVLLDEKSGDALCVIDLDTVMPGLCAYDFGDSIRFGAATAAEDEKDLEKMTLSVDLFETYAKGYLAACPGLTPLERETLPLAARTMTLECGMRFLTDFLQGDTYFATSRPGQNLDRARTQIKLVREGEEKEAVLFRIVREL